MRIWKYVVNMIGLTEIQIPEGSEFVKVGLLNGEICVWAIVDPDKPNTTRKILSVWTGDEAGSILNYIGIAKVESTIYHIVEVE